MGSNREPASYGVLLGQSASDILKKILKTEGFESKNLSELMQIAQKTFNNRGNKEDKPRHLQKFLLQLRNLKEVIQGV